MNKDLNDQLAPAVNSKLLSALLVSLFAALLVAPVVRMIHLNLDVPVVARLGGVEEATSFPTFSVNAVLDGTFQTAFERWFAKHVGFREQLVRADNQLNYSLFRFTPQRTVLGRDNFLFEPSYIEDLNNLYPMSDEQIGALVDRLAQLNALLKARGSRLLVMLTPSKAATYPEKIPSRLLPAARRADNYERFVRRLQEQEVPTLDSIPFVRQSKNESIYPVFPPGGAHWTKYISCKVGELFTARLANLLQRAVPQLSCDPPLIKTNPTGVDRDLAKLTNLWSPSIFNVPLPHPRVRVAAAPDAYRAKLLFVGDSFLWSFFDALERKQAYESRDFFYYYKSHDRYRARRRKPPRTPIDFAALDWSYIFSRDLIVLEFNEINIRELGYGFVEDALRELGR